MSITRGMTKALLASILGLGLVAGAISCGGQTTNNDQGTSFLAFGYFTPGTETTPISFVDALLAPDTAVIVAANDGIPFQADGNRVVVKLGVQNRLTNQFIRLERIECDYGIPGASPLLSIPSDSFNTAVIISASPQDDTTATDDTTTTSTAPLPVPVEGPEGAESGSAAFAAFQIVSPDIMSYINVNRNLLPELPFRLNATCRAVGVSQAGDVFVTNDLQFQINFFDQAECCTGATSETGGDDGGFQSGDGGSFAGTGTDEDGDTAAVQDNTFGGSSSTATGT